MPYLKGRVHSDVLDKAPCPRIGNLLFDGGKSLYHFMCIAMKACLEFSETDSLRGLQLSR